MADPDADHEFLYNEQGLVDILQSPFFDPNPEVDDTVDDYIERIIFTLAPSIEEHLFNRTLANHRTPINFSTSGYFSNEQHRKHHLSPNGVPRVACNLPPLSQPFYERE
ncbi:hypothetical protein M5K25_017678 [Dendrobium thyrsiflorum]|uniref:Uncharacterized protein n=1 Tax=Dendrobium thyrsiflorum TaxID=117978 RepID=A0ABD0UNN1_DENTH